MTTGSILYPVRRIPLVNIRIDGGTQVRAAMNKATVDEYAAALEEGADFPPVTVFQDYEGADLLLADGFHRFMAHQKAGLVDVLAEVVPGSRRNALFYALGANSKHGLNRTIKDKRRAVELLLNDSEWSANSDRWIASVAGVSNKFVGDMRRELTVNGTQSTERTGKDGRTINTANIGRGKSTPAEEAPAKTPGQVAEEKIRAATTLDELDAAYQEASKANLSDRECEEIAEARQERGAELRAQAQTTTPAPAPAAVHPAPVGSPPPAPTPTPPRGQVDLFTQEPAPQPVLAETVTVSKTEWEALNAKVAAYDAWIALVDQRTYALAPTIKGEANLERVRRLIELAGSPAENEARSAAVMACRMIREQGVTLLTSDPSILDDIYGVNRRILKIAEEMGVKP